MKMPNLLLFEQAAPHLRKAFRNQGAISLRKQETNEGPLWKVIVHVPPDFVDPEAALKAFDEEWWLDNCHRSHGSLVFDYELGEKE